MTLKKSMISIAAAGVIAATITGCGSSSGGSSSNGGGSTSATSIKVIDGEVINAAASVKYIDENNVTRTVAITNKDNFYSIAPEVKAGSATYDISEVNSSVLDNMVGVVFEGNTTLTENGVTYATTFMDADGNGELNTTAGDVLGDTAYIAAPAGFSVATPISTLIYSLVDPEVNTDINESNRTALVEAATEDIAKALGLTASDIKTVDPLTVIETNPAYALLTALIGATTADAANPTAIKTIAASLKTKTAATTPSEALENMALVDTANATMFREIKKVLVDPNAINDVKNWNLDSVREKDGEISYLTSGSADFNVTSLQYKDVNVSDLVSHGAKINQNDTIKIELAADGNVSTKNVSLVINFANPRHESMKGDKDAATLTVSLPLEINATDSTIAARINPSALIAYEGIAENDDDVASVLNGDKNISSIDGNLTADDVLDATTVNTLKINASALLAAIDGNMSTTTTGDFDFDPSIAKFQVVLVDEDKAFQRTAAKTGKTTYWGNTQVVSAAGKIATTGKTILNLNTDSSLADMRGADTGENADGNASTTITLAEGNTTNINTFILASEEVNATIEFADSSADKNIEQNATVKNIKSKNGFVSLTKTALTDLNVSKAGYNELNITTLPSKINAAAKGSFPTDLILYTAVDEFDAAGKEQNLTLIFDRKPTITKGSSTITFDNNVSGTIATLIDPDSNTSDVTDLITDKNITMVNDNNVSNNVVFGEDFNLTIGDANVTMKFDINATTGVITSSYSEANNTVSGDIDFKINATDGNNTTTVDVNLTKN